MKNHPNIKKQNIVLFNLDEQRYALYLAAVEQVIRAVEITPLPKSPDIVLGIINFYGSIMPVIDLRRRFRLPTREIELDDQFIIVQTSKRLVVLAADSVTGVLELECNNVIETKETFPYADYLSGITKIENNIVLISDPEKFLSLNENILLDESLSGGKG